MSKKYLTAIFFGLSALYFLTHVIGLTALPVFADEAIYIRWAQLIIDNWQEYLFFPLNDGKTPLFMWLLVPFQYLFSDQLFAARIVSVVIGYFQFVITWMMLRLLTKKNSVVIFGSFLTIVLPFWYIHHRMALTEALLGLTVSISVYGVLRLVQAKKSTKKLLSTQELISVLLVACGVGLGLLTKIPAVLTLPALYVVLLMGSTQKSYLLRKATFLTVGIVLGGVLFALLRIHPAFSQLFARGSDFLYPLSEVLMGRWWSNVLRIPRYAYFFMWYLTLPGMLLLLFGLFAKQVQKKVHIFFWAGVLVCLPIFIMGKVVHPRYFFPAVIFFTLAMALSFEGVLEFFARLQQRFIIWFALTIGVALLVSNLVTQSFQFIVTGISEPDSIPFVLEDRYQYLEAWSSGHGILELTQLLSETAQTTSVALATEGSFGTLPDGILLYQHQRNVDNIYVEGVNFPSQEFPANFVERAQQYDAVWYVANEDRVLMNVEEFEEVVRYCRPYAAPCLVVWDVTEFVKQ